ncbi:nucleotide-diphospho-sugar transferase [Lactarius hengduanensis]|nr:nucleotide-diphospho-sugar transferase [Lactarius hengduanensis]
MSLSRPFVPQSSSEPASGPNALSVEAMFSQIMDVVLKSRAEIAELRHECTELRQANLSLERQVREGIAAQIRSPHLGTPGFNTPAPSSPQLRAKSPFLLASSIPTLAVPPSLHIASPLGDNTVISYPYGPNREIPGFYVVIPAGGAGTRLWPLSREGHPKFLLDVTLQGRSLIQATWDRLLPLTGADRLAVVAGPGHVKSISEQLPDLLQHNLFCEPGPKDSMAAIGLAAAILAQRDPDAVIGSFAADHMISGTDAFLSAVSEAVLVAQKGYLVTIGIAPSHPSTGFGYVRLGDKLGMAEAPNARLVTFLLDLLREYKPELAEGLLKIAAVWDVDEVQRNKVLEEVWPGLEKIAIDHAVAEPAALEGRVAVVPATFGWDDVGDFSSLAELLPAEANQPRILGDSGLVLTEQVAGGIVVPGSGRLVACLGVDDLVIVDMPDTLLVTTRARSQEVKRLVKKAKESGWRRLL